MGLSFRDGEMLKRAGIRAVETAGAGGTSWIGVETERAEGVDLAAGQMLWDFGIPTGASVAWMADLGFETVASGGVYSALDAARAIRLGACAVALARPWLIAWMKDGKQGLRRLVNELVTGLTYTMLCVGAKDISALQQVDCLIGDALQRYIDLPRNRR